mmetsp:Transcript_22442/g.59815  ORF Transcript_22442/g.59815 Transcript_22442/m.59815 type:complete len:389 (-) Transcript_22442:88-1254(-)
MEKSLEIAVNTSCCLSTMPWHCRQNPISRCSFFLLRLSRSRSDCRCSQETVSPFQSLAVPSWPSNILAMERVKDSLPFRGTSHRPHESVPCGFLYFWVETTLSMQDVACAPRRSQSLRIIRRSARSCGRSRSRLYLTPGWVGSHGYSSSAEKPLLQPSQMRRFNPLPSRVSMRSALLMPSTPSGLFERSSCSRVRFEPIASSRHSAARKSMRLRERSRRCRHRSRDRCSMKHAAGDATSAASFVAAQLDRFSDLRFWFSASFSPRLEKMSAEKQFHDRSSILSEVLANKSPTQPFTSMPLPSPASARRTSFKALCSLIAQHKGLWLFIPIWTPLRSKWRSLGVVSQDDSILMMLDSVPMPTPAQRRRLNLRRLADAPSSHRDAISIDS